MSEVRYRKGFLKSVPQGVVHGYSQTSRASHKTRATLLTEPGVSSVKKGWSTAGQVP